jgi:gas vesicle protein
MKKLEKLDSLFNIEPINNIEKDIINVVEPLKNNSNLDQDEDYELARATLRKVIISGSDALDDITNLAKNSEHPRAYEVTGQIMKTLSDVSKDLMGLQKQVKELKATENPANQIGTQNNIVFAGSTHELMKLLNNKDGNTIDQ